VKVAILGGTGSFGHALAHRLAALGEDEIVIGSRDAARAQEAAEAIGGSHVSGATNEDAVRDADIVHTHLVHADVYGGAAALLRRTQLVSTKHNDDPFRTGSFRVVERALSRAADRVIAITEALMSPKPSAAT